MSHWMRGKHKCMMLRNRNHGRWNNNDGNCYWHCWLPSRVPIALHIIHMLSGQGNMHHKTHYLYSQGWRLSCWFEHFNFISLLQASIVVPRLGLWISISRCKFLKFTFSCKEFLEFTTALTWSVFCWFDGQRSESANLAWYGRCS